MTPHLEDAAATLSLRRDEIISNWISTIRQEISAAKTLPPSLLVDSLPGFLDNLIQVLLPDYPRDMATEGSSIAIEHGSERAKFTEFTPMDLMREYQVTRDIIFWALAQEIEMNDEIREIVRKSIDKAMSEALNAYLLISTKQREQSALSLGHDLRSPLSAALGYAQMIVRNASDPERVKKHASAIVSSLKRVDVMIEDLLNAGRLRMGGKIDLRLQTVDLDQLISSLLSLFHETHGDRFVYQNSLINGFWDQDALTRALENLINNALKYGDDDKIIISSQEHEGCVMISVHNKGNPIALEDQAALFAPFQRSPDSTKFQGWGLGLSQVKTMAESHGGTVMVDSSLDRGTTFTMTLPIDSRVILPGEKT